MLQEITFLRLKKQASQADGFTLVETLVTLLIAGLMVLVAIGTYRSAAKRNLLQSQAIQLLARLEQVKSQSQSQSLGANQLQGTEFRMLINPTISPSTSACNCYLAQYFDRTTNGWVTADTINSATGVPLTLPVSFGANPASATTITTSPPEQPSGSPSQATEIRFNSRGFPVSNATDPPTAIQAANAVYLNDGISTYAVVVNPLGRVKIYAYDRGGSNSWIQISR